MKDFNDEKEVAYTWNQYAVWIIKLLERLDAQGMDHERRLKEVEVFDAKSCEEEILEELKEVNKKIKSLELINAQYTGEKLGKKATLAIIGAVIASVLSLGFTLIELLLKL